MFKKVKNNRNLLVFVGLIFLGVSIVFSQFIKQKSIEKQNHIERIQDCYDKGYKRYYYDKKNDLCRFREGTVEEILQEGVW